MGEWVTAQEGDSFCSIAIQCGFVNCDPVRNHAANAAIAGAQLRATMRVYVPELTERQDSAPTETTHRFVRLAAPLVRLRFVHGTRDREIPDDPDLPHLEIGNYRTDRAGTNGLDAFAAANQWRFHAPSDADPDAFKVELIHPRAGAAQLPVILEAMHPLYAAGIAINWDDRWSSDAERARRRLEVTVYRATPQPDQRYRSGYLRLVVDDQDKAARNQQTLLVSDDQPNEEQVEMLDQAVRATYLLDTCTRPENVRCRATHLVPVGNNRRRIRLCVGIFRRNAGDATGFNGLEERHIRHRVFRWFRRVYAQANMAPKLVDPGIRLLDPPDRNMVTVSNIHGNPARGQTAGGASPSELRLRVTTDRGGGVTVSKPVRLPIPLPATVAARPTPIQLANLLVALINDADFTATAFENPPCLGRLRTRCSADILVRDTAGGHVTISDVSSTDRAATLTLAIVNLDRVTDHADRDMEFGTIEQRQIMRNSDSGVDRLDCYVVGRFHDRDLRGRAFSPCYELDADYQPGAKDATNPSPCPAPFTCMMASTSTSGAVMDLSDNLPYTFPHEAGHSLLDCFHTANRSELMAGGGTSRTPRLRGTKRLCDLPVRVVYANYHPTQTWPGRTGSFLYSMASRLGSISPALFEPW